MGYRESDPAAARPLARSEIPLAYRLVEVSIEDDLREFLVVDNTIAVYVRLADHFVHLILWSDIFLCTKQSTKKYLLIC